MEESRPIPMFRCEQIEGGKLAKEWQEWKSSLEYYFEASQVSDQKSMRSKMLHLGGPQLQKVFSTLEGTEDFPLVMLEKRWYDVAVDRLDAYFKPRKQDVLERHRLRSMKQGSTERFSHYVLRLRQQLKDCGLEKYSQEVKSIMEEIMLVDVIVEGCNSQELRRKILEKDRSLNDIEALGESLESVRIQEQELKIGKNGIESGFSEVCKVQKVLTSRKERREDKIMSRFPTAASTLNKDTRICFACGRQGHMSKSPLCPAKDQNCRRCKKPGHFENVCRKRPSGSHFSVPPKKVQIVEEVQDDVQDTPQPASQPASQPAPFRTAAEKKVYYTFYTGSDTNVFDCAIGGVKIEVFIDSGSDVNLITSDAWEKLKVQQVIVSKCERGSSKILKAYASSQPLIILGTFQAVIEIGKRSIEAEFLVVENGQRNLLGDTTSKQLGILKIGLEINQVMDSDKDAPFSKITDTKIRISMDPTITPVFQPLRRIPIPLEVAVNQKLDELLRRDIIEPKVGPATWVSPLVVANKANGTIRLCVDLRRVNQAVIRERHPMPVIDDVLAKVGKGKVWSILDVKDAFFLLELEEESRDIVTFITHRGLYRFKRLPFGLVSAPEIFQRKMDEILADCEGTYWYLDDVGVEGSSVEEHDLRLKKVFDRFEERGVILNWDKCKIRVTDFEFLGYHINPQGIMPSDSKRDAIMSFRQPLNESEVRSFLGLANYMGKFIPNLAAIDEPLRRLTQKGVKFHWDEKEESAFRAIQQSLAGAQRLGFYKLEDRTSVIADASPYALGGVLIQTDASGNSRVICYASKSLTDTERRYCQTEKEALVLVWSVERFQVYLIGKEFNLLTDCKALIFLFTPVSRPCARIERWVLRLQSFQYKIVHISGHTNIADVLSRLSTFLPTPFDETEELGVNEVVTAAAKTIALKWEEIENMSRDDPEIIEINEALRSGMVDNLPLAYKIISSELCMVNDVLLRGDRIVVPNNLCERTLKLAHEGHPGVRIMKTHLRGNVWWPKMDLDVERFVKACRGCSLVSAPSAPEPMMRKELPSRVWEHIAVDFLGPLPNGENLLVCVDYYSRYLEVVEMMVISTSATIGELLTIFSRYGIPEVLRADNGPQFSSEEFRNFCDEYGIHLESTIPYWPQMNGEVERQNRSILKRLRIAQELGQDWRQELRKYLMMYHSASHTTTGKAPAELMFGRKMRTKLPYVLATTMDSEEVRDRDRLEKEKGRVYSDNRRRAKPNTIEVGDHVLAKRMKKDNKLSSDFAPEEFSVVQKKGTEVIIRSTESGKEYRRSATHLKAIPRKINDSTDQVPNSSIHSNQQANETVGELIAPFPMDGDSTEEVVRTSKRIRSESKLLKDYVTY